VAARKPWLPRVDCSKAARNEMRMRNQKSHKLAWAAGFFDGEGYVGLRHNKRDDSGWLSAIVTQKDRRLLERFQQYVGFGRIGKPSKTGVSNIAFTNSADVLKLYELLAPYLGPQKTEQFMRSFQQWFANRKKRGRVKI
jgi:hypothetical protein